MIRSFLISRKKPRQLVWQAFSCLLTILTLNSAVGSASVKEDGLALSQPLTVTWRYESDRTTDLTPAADNTTVFVPQDAGVLIALNAADGKLQWRAEAGGEFSAAPAADDRSVYVATRYTEPDQKHVHGALRAISKSTGVTLWMRTLSAPIAGCLVTNETALFGGSIDGHVFAFDKRTGLAIWSVQYAEEFSGQPATTGSLVYFGSNAGILRALDVKTGNVVWQYKTRGPIQGSIAVRGNIVYFGSGDGNVYAFSEIRSKIVWQRRTGAAVQAVAAVENGLLASSLDNFVYLLSLNKGSLVWRRQLPGRISARPLTSADGALFTPFSTDSAIVLNLRDGKPANTLPLGEENSSAAAPISVNKLVLITTPHGLLAFSAPRQ
jgi:outer membrane protein assembly factor BamB